MMQREHEGVPVGPGDPGTYAEGLAKTILRAYPAGNPDAGIAEPLPLPWRRVLALAPHADDAELGAGGTIARLRRTGVEVRIAAFCVALASQTNPPVGSDCEMQRACAVLGVAASALWFGPFPVRTLPERRPDVRETLRWLVGDFHPDAVLLPSSTDCHQDHQVVHQEGLRIFQNTTLLGYDFPWNSPPAGARCYIRLATEDLSKKQRALEMYVSQILRGRPYFRGGQMESLAAVRGLEHRGELSESFEAVRVVL
jgi:LmbE family N-acetylglucosaminyl deacetylase